MSFDPEWEPVHFVENQRVEVGNAVGIFARADSRDVTPEQVESNLDDLNPILKEFATDQNLEYVPSALCYQDDFKMSPTILKMAHTTMNLKGFPSLNDSYFVLDIRSLNGDEKYVVRLNDRLRTQSYNLSVWRYDEGKFNRMSDVEGKKSNNEIYLATSHLYRFSDPKELNPFREIAITVNPSLREKASH
jgi:hypothetical protein